jgi:hypothetical protein
MTTDFTVIICLKVQVEMTDLAVNTSTADQWASFLRNID